MMSGGKKLVRGLRDISPIFEAIPEEGAVRRAPEIQIVGVSSPDCDGDSFLLNTFFASQIASPEKPCSLLSVLSRSGKFLCAAERNAPESFGGRIERYCLYWDELRDLLSAPVPLRTEGALRSRDIFLDFEYRQLLHYEKAVSLLDKWVLLLRPTAESLTEGYKTMKAGLTLNPQLEFFITLAGKTAETRGAALFDRFSDFATQHLNVNLGWLGWIDLGDPTSHFSASLHTELLQYQDWNPKPNLQKFMLSAWIESLEKTTRPNAAGEALQ